MKRLDLYRTRVFALACCGLAGTVFVSCGSGDVVDSSDTGTEEGMLIMGAEINFNDLLTKDSFVDSLIAKCKADPTWCDVGELPSTPSSSSVTEPGSSSSTSTEPGSSSSSSDSEPGSSSSSVSAPSSSSNTPGSSSSSSSSATKPSSSSSLPSSSSSSSSSRPVSSSSSSSSSVSVEPGDEIKTPFTGSLATGTYTVIHSYGTALMLQGTQASCIVNVNGDDIDISWSKALGQDGTKLPGSPVTLIITSCNVAMISGW